MIAKCLLTCNQAFHLGLGLMIKILYNALTLSGSDLWQT